MPLSEGMLLEEGACTLLDRAGGRLLLVVLVLTRAVLRRGLRFHLTFAALRVSLLNTVFRFSVMMIYNDDQ